MWLSVKANRRSLAGGDPAFANLDETWRGDQRCRPTVSRDPEVSENHLSRRFVIRWTSKRRGVLRFFTFALATVAASFVATPAASATAADTLDYAAVDPELRLERLDSSPNESFLSMRADSAGRLFVGGREALFVYEPAADGRFAPRKELLRFPPDSWVYDIEVRGHDLYVLTLSALYVIPDGVVKRQGLQPKRLLWGVPRYHVHQCFHALAWGPEGDLYVSMGDTLVHYGDFDRPDHWGHWTFFTPEDKAGIPYTGQGGDFTDRIPTAADCG